MNGACTDLPPANEKLVPVFTTMDRAKVYEVVQHLKEEEFPFWIKDEDHASDDYGPIQVLVFERHAREAIKLLNRWDYLWRAFLRPVNNPAQREPELTNQIDRGCFWFLLVAFFFLPGNYKFLVFPAYACVIFVVWMPGLAYQRRLRSLGYEWPTITDATEILWICKTAAFRLPPASDVEVIPGSARDRDFIICFLSNFEEYRRRAKWKRKSVSGSRN